MPVTGQIPMPDRFCILGCNRTGFINLGQVSDVRGNPGVFGIHPGVQRRAVNLRGADVNRMMLLEPGCLLSQGIQCRRMLLADKIRPHAVPNDHYHMLGLAFWGC